MKRRLTEITIVMLGILIGVLTNVATGVLPEMLPTAWRQYLWLAWLPLALSILLVVVLEWRASRDQPAATTGATVGGDTLDAQQAQGVVIRPSAPIAQTNVIDKGGRSGAAADPRIESNVAVGDNKGTVIGTNIGTQIINQAQAAAALHQLRAPVGDFVGREREIDQLVQALSKATAGGTAAAISGVRGMGGIGKTELAYAAAQQLSARFPDAQLLVELRGASSNSLTPQQALQRIIQAFEREAKLPDDLDQLQALYRDKLSGKHALILADDARDAAQVRPLLPPAGCALLITSRNRFALPGMAALDLGTLPTDEAEKLLLSVCPRIGEQAATLAKLCGYLPLALRVSASLLANSSRSVAHYLEQLEAERLKYLSDPDDVQASVEASLRLSYDALEPAAQVALAQMSVFAASFDLAAASAVLEVEADAEALVDLLVRRSLLDWDEQLQRFSLHDLVRVFAATQFDDEQSVRLRYARYYARLAQRVNELYMQGGEALLAGLALFDRERIHIDAGWEWVRRQAPSSESDNVIRDYSYLTAYISDLRYHPRRERIPQLEAALSAARRSGDRGAEGAWLGNLGNAYRNLGDARTAIDFYEQALVIEREIGDRRAESNALGGLGNAYYALGDARTAIDFHEQALVIVREIGDRRAEGAILGNLGNAYYALGDARKAIDFYQQDLAVAREIGDRRGEGTVLGGLGTAYYALGDAHKAIDFYEQRLAIAREIGERRGEGNALGGLGNAYYALGDARTAIDFHEQALVIDREIGDRRGEGNALGNLGNAYYALGDARKAIDFHEQALVIDREIGDRRAEGAILGNLGIAYANLGDARTAIDFYEQALVIDREIGDRRGEGADLGNLGIAYADVGDAHKAIDFFEQRLGIARELGDRRGEGNALGNLGIAYASLGDARTAIDFYEQWLGIARQIGDRRAEAMASWNLGLALEKQGDLARAAQSMQVYVDFLAEIGHPDAQKRAARLEQLRQRLADGE